MARVALRTPVSLATCPLFDELAADELECVDGEGDRRSYGPGDIVLGQGEAVDHLLILLHGVVRIVMVEADRGEMTVRLLQAPSVIAEMELLTRTVSTKYVEVLRPSEVFALARGRFERVMATHPRVTRKLLQDVCLRFRATAVNQAFTALQPVERRLASLLLSYARVFGAAVAGGVQIVTDTVTQQSLATGVAATRKSIQRALTRWSERGLVSRRGRHYVLNDVAALEAIAGHGAPRLEHSMGRGAGASARKARGR